MSSLKDSRTAGRITAAAKAAAPGFRLTTTTIAPHTYRTTIAAIDPNAELIAAGRAVRNRLLQLDLDATWGIVRPRGRNAIIVVTSVDDAARDAEVAKLAADREEALAEARAELSDGYLAADTAAEVERTAAEPTPGLARLRRLSNGDFRVTYPAADGSGQTFRNFGRRQAEATKFAEQLNRGRAEHVAAAVAQFQEELTRNADAIGRVLSEPLPGEEV